MTCPKCARAMEPGFLLDIGDGSAKLQATWVEGEAAPLSWFGRVRLKGRKPVPVTTFRCERCGYLESYAAEPPSA